MQYLKSLTAAFALPQTDFVRSCHCDDRCTIPVGDVTVFSNESNGIKWTIKFDYRTRNPKWAHEVIRHDSSSPEDTVKYKVAAQS